MVYLAVGFLPTIALYRSPTLAWVETIVQLVLTLLYAIIWWIKFSVYYVLGSCIWCMAMCIYLFTPKYIVLALQKLAVASFFAKIAAFEVHWHIGLCVTIILLSRFWSLWKGCVGFAAIITKVSAHGSGVYSCLPSII